MSNSAARMRLKRREDNGDGLAFVVKFTTAGIMAAGIIQILAPIIVRVIY